MQESDGISGKLMLRRSIFHQTHHSFSGHRGVGRTCRSEDDQS